MLISRRTPISTLEVLEPRYNDRRVLLASWKLGTHNRVVFPKAPSMPGEYYIAGERARTYPVQDMKTKAGGTAKMYQVPIDDLEPLEYKEDLRDTALDLFDD